MDNQEPKYRVVKAWIQNKIQDGTYSYGEKILSESALSEKFQVSRQTVRQAISGLIAEGYLEAKRGSGTYVAYRPGIRAEKTKNIGILSSYVDDYIFPSIIRGMSKVLTASGYSMQIAFTLNQVSNETQALEDMIRRGVDGIIVEPTKSRLPNPNFSLYREISHSGLPVLFFNAYYEGLPIPYIALDDQAAGRLATESLLRAGHIKIGGFFKGDDMQGHLRYQGFMEALAAHHVIPDAKNQIWFFTEDFPTLFEDEQKILSRLAGCTAVFCYNDQIANSLLKLFHTQKIRVPQDVSVISIDNSILADQAQQAISSINHPKEQLGKLVAANMVKMIEDPHFDANHIFEAKLVDRGSVAKNAKKTLF